jgi:hypothetical protein
MREKELWVAYVLWFFCGLWGIHKFYLGKIGMGILYILTCGFFFIGWFIDLFTLPSQVERYNLRELVKANNRYQNYQNQSNAQNRMENFVRKARRMEQRLRNIEDIVTSEEYNFHRRLYSR